MRDGFTSLTLATVDESGDFFGSKEKRIIEADLTVQSRAPGPGRRVLSIETSDGWVYRFQRYGENEPWVRYQRVRPDGDVMTGLSGVLPTSVEEFVDHVDELDVDVQAAIEASSSSPRAVADGGDSIECARCGSDCPENLAEHGKCPRCMERQRREEQAVEESMRTTWVDDPAEGTYGDRP